MCFIWLFERTVTFALYIINRLVFITEVGSVYCAVHTESLRNTDTSRPEKVKAFFLAYFCLSSLIVWLTQFGLRDQVSYPCYTIRMSCLIVVLSRSVDNDATKTHFVHE
jgi:hypothetical protein